MWWWDTHAHTRLTGDDKCYFTVWRNAGRHSLPSCWRNTSCTQTTEAWELCGRARGKGARHTHTHTHSHTPCPPPPPSTPPSTPQATVGAGLPVIATLKHLVDTGDRVLRVEGVLSGTLSYIFNTLAPGVPFSAVVAGAKAAGYTEPDPRDDLSGTDVARKVTILAREAGVPLELSDVPVQSLVPPALDSAPSADAFMAGLPQHDAAMEARLAAAAAKGAVLRYVGVVDVAARTGSVELREYPADHAFAALAGADNVIAFTTARYKDQPLIVRGPGAGAEVTAGGVFSDVLRLVAYLGAPS